MLLYFGERWNAQRFREQACRQVTTPVGVPCLYCTEAVEGGDRGVVLAYFAQGEAKSAPAHMECDLRMSVGSVAHLTSQCICCGVQGEKPYPGTFREEALAVLAIVNDERHSAGQPQL